jgi:hypothetical protein
VLQKYESDEDVGMKEIEDKNESGDQGNEYAEMKEDKNESGNQDSEMKCLTEFRDWSLQLTDDNSLLITGKTNQ